MTAQNFYANGKVLLTGEYAVLDGATALALPTKLGQHMHIEAKETSPSQTPLLHWKAFTPENKIWIEAKFDLKNFDLIDSVFKEIKLLEILLKEIRHLNPDFIKTENTIHATTTLDFNPHWGLGSSSTLISLIAQWANISPYKLAARALPGSYYDIACANADGPILYRLENSVPHIQKSTFNPAFKHYLYFIYLGKKQDTRAAIENLKNPKPEMLISEINDLTSRIEKTKTLAAFEMLIKKHEHLISKTINKHPIQETLFSDFWGQTKSLGAWGGDFMLATSDRGAEATFAYFKDRGYKIGFTYEDLILSYDA